MSLSIGEKKLTVRFYRLISFPHAEGASRFNPPAVETYGVNMKWPSYGLHWPWGALGIPQPLIYDKFNIY